MRNKPIVVFCVYNDACMLKELLNSITAKDRYGEVSLAVRVLRVNDEDSLRESWIRVSGDEDSLKSFELALRRVKGLRISLVYDSYYSKVYSIVYPKSMCKVGRCPYISPPLGAMAKTMLIYPQGVLVEYILSKTMVLRKLKDLGCKPILVHSIEDMDYMLTRKQELALVQAYLRGYYDYPRKISLKELACEVGIAVSTLAELLRRAEAKIVEAFIRHELPHYIIKKMLSSFEETINTTRSKPTGS